MRYETIYRGIMVEGDGDKWVCTIDTKKFERSSMLQIQALIDLARPETTTQKLMKLQIPIVALFVMIVLTGCSTSQSVAKSAGKGTKEIFDANYERTWAAAVSACQSGQLSIKEFDKEAGTIIARAKTRAESWGENVGVWVRKVEGTRTEVEVVSQRSGPALLFWYNWEPQVLTSIRASLSVKAD